MYPDELNRLTTKFTVSSGHNMCHPETCCCREYLVHKKLNKKLVFSSNNASEVKGFLASYDTTYSGD